MGKNTRVNGNSKPPINGRSDEKAYSGGLTENRGASEVPRNIIHIVTSNKPTDVPRGIVESIVPQQLERYQIQNNSNKK